MENLKQIAESIIAHYDYEFQNYVVNKAIGRSKALINNLETTYWLTNLEHQGNYGIRRNIKGDAVDTYIDTIFTYTEDGTPVYKNSKVGEILIRNCQGKINYSFNNKNFSLTIYNRASYSGSGKEVVNVLINIADDKRAYKYNNIKEIINDIKKIEKEIEEEKQKEILSEQDRKEQLRRIKEKEKELELKKYTMQAFIRSNVELRSQHIIDEQQDIVKRSNIYNKSLIIDGGPGTGKTTILIQRIKFLKSNSIQDYIELQKPSLDEVLIQNNWIFFSPNELLRLYLKNNMTGEGLQANDGNVKVWSAYKNELCKRYKLFNTETKRPFLDLNKATEYLNLSSDNIKTLSTDFDTYCFTYQREKFSKISKIDVDKFKWKFTKDGIIEKIDKSGKLNDWNSWIKLYVDLFESYDNRARDIVSNFNQNVENLANNILFKLKKNETLLNDVYNFFEDSSTSIEENINEDENEEESQDFEETDSTQKQEKENVVFKKLKSIIRKIALIKFDNSTKLTKIESKVVEAVPELKENEKYNEIGEYAFFIKYFKRVINGPVLNLLSEIAKSYKLFRKERLEEYLTKEGKLVLEHILRDKNIRIHSDEQAFLLYKINTIIKHLFKNNREIYNDSTNPYILAFQDCKKVIIAIDEVSDFSVLDLISLSSLSNPLISSITMSGDLMQRMTKNGIKRWNDLDTFFDLDVKEINISYRQSHTLLQVAKKLYFNELGTEPSFKSYGEKDPNEPQPLNYFSTNEKNKVEWISDRIIEIHNAYGRSIPSIAIFVSEKHDEFLKEINGLDTLSDVGIKAVLCKDGQILGDKNTVRIFPIEYIKGLEFEAAFFHNIDCIQNEELLLRYLYVGLSRATFYLGVTGINDFPKSISSIKELFKTGNWK